MSRLLEFRLEVVVVPVTDVDRAKHFYADPDGNAWTVQESATMRVQGAGT